MSKKITLTKSRIKQIIKEEVEKYLNEEDEQDLIKNLDKFPDDLVSSIEQKANDLSGVAAKAGVSIDAHKKEIGQALQQLRTVLNKMTTKTVTINEIQKKFKEILKLALKGNEIIILDDNKEVAKLLPIIHFDKPRIPDLNKGKIRMSKDFDEPLHICNISLS